MSKKRYDIREHGPKTMAQVPQFDGYTVGQWCSSPDGTGSAEAVILAIDFKRKVMLGISTDCIFETDQIALRLKSRHAINTLIEIIERHRDEVFPL